MEKIVVIGPFNPAMQAALKKHLSSERFLLLFSPEMDVKLLSEADYIILRTLSIGQEQLALMKHVKLIQRWGAGYDTVDIEAAGKKGIPVAVTAGINAIPVSEMALALMLGVYRNLVAMTVDSMNGIWNREYYSGISYTISGKTVGIYGFGNIGKKVASLVKAFGAQVLYFDPFRMTPELEAALGVTYAAPEELLRNADILSLHAPLTNETAYFINTHTLSLMKSTAVLINTARAELVDYPAVAEALKQRKLLGAGFDAIEHSLLENNPFRGMKNVVFTQHLGGNTVDNAEHMAKRIGEQINAVSNGQRLAPPHLVNGCFLVG